MRLRKQAGLTLVTALAFTLVVGTILAGVGTVTLSHYTRSGVEGTYASAIAMAEAGVNYEIAWISRDTTDFSRAHQEGAPWVGTVAGSPGQFSVFVRRWGSSCDGSGTWTPPEDVCIISTGTVHGISRTVRVRGIRKSIFDEYAIFAVDEGTFNGGGQSTGSTEIVGNMGTNGDLTFNGSTGTHLIDGELSLNGDGASSNETGSNVITNGDPVEFPTVSEMADALFPGGLTWLQTNNNNAAIRQIKSTDTAIAGEPDIANFTMSDFTSKLDSAGFTAASRLFGDAPNGVPASSSALDAPDGARFAHAYDPLFDAAGVGVQGKSAWFVPPGDYYFHQLDFQAGNKAIVLLTHLGRIRIWVDEGGTGNQADRLKTNVIFTDMAPSKFRLFYNKCNEITIEGSTRFNGGFYAVRDGCASGLPEMNFTGNTMIYGSVISNGMTLGGGTKVIFPNDGGGADPTDWSLWFGFKDSWKEISLSANPVFVDGTSK